MPVYGYAAVNTSRKVAESCSLEAQKKILLEHGVEKIYEDRYTDGNDARPDLRKAVNVLHTGYVLITTTFDGLARTATEGVTLINEIVFERGTTLNILNMGSLDREAGQLLINALTMFTKFEREQIIMRAQANKAAARECGGREGRPPKYTAEQYNSALRLLEFYSYDEVNEMTGISRSSLIRKNNERRAIEGLSELERNSEGLAWSLTFRAIQAIIKGDHAAYENVLHCLEDVSSQFGENEVISRWLAKTLAFPPLEYSPAKRKEYLQRLEQLSLRFNGCENIALQLAQGCYIYMRCLGYQASDEIIPRLERLVKLFPENRGIKEFLDYAKNPETIPSLNSYDYIIGKRKATSRRTRKKKI